MKLPSGLNCKCLTFDPVNAVEFDSYNNFCIFVAAGAQGFTPPLASGSYAFLIRQAAASTSYQFNFNVTPVPEPGSMCLIGLSGAAVLGRFVRKRTRRHAAA